MKVEFNPVRSKSYKSAIERFPKVWIQDLGVMYEYLSPQPGDVIVELGAGSGFYSEKIATEIGEQGKLIVIEPSIEQLLPIIRGDYSGNIEFICQTAESAKITSDRQVNKIWTRGAFHHVKEKEQALRNLAYCSADKAQLYIFDIFSSTSVARFFDSFVARACTTGHEVSFLSREYAQSLCYVTGWKEPRFVDIPLQWEFDSSEDIGVFLSMMLSIKSEYTSSDVEKIAIDTLGAEVREGKFYLNWPMTLLISEKE